MDRLTIFFSRRQKPNRRLLIQWFFIALICHFCTASGCVSRRMTFVSNPPGAMVLLEGKEIGYSPASADFTWYGTRRVTMIKDGYETKTELVTVSAPFYQWPIIEFFADNFSPYRITDRRTFNFDLQPKQLVPDEELRDRAGRLRRETQFGE
jgi:hypothetical protein